MTASVAPAARSSAASTVGVVVLVAANVLVGVQAVSHGWGYYQTLIVYWLEAVMIGGFNTLRLLAVGFRGARPFGALTAQASRTTVGTRIVLTLLGTGFFVFKFGAFALATGFLVLALPAWTAHGDSDNFAHVMQGVQKVGAGVALSAGALWLSHAISFVVNFLLGGEYRTRSVLGLVFWPYARLALVGAVLVAGIVFAQVLPGAQATALFVIVMVGAKTAADLVTHVVEHRRWRAPPPWA